MNGWYILCARPLCLKVTSLPLDIQQKGGPISIMSDVAQLFSLTGMKSVTVKKKDKEVYMPNIACVVSTI